MATQPTFILVNPQMGENIGGAARAMLNCGLENLDIVNPRDGWPNPRADAMSSGALELMPDVGVYSTTAEAVAECHHVYATTARPRDMIKPVMTPEKAATDIATRMNAGQKCAVLFGGERAGLSNDDVALSQTIITAPLNPKFSSLNLSQAVLMLAYEIAKHDISPEASAIDKLETVTNAELEAYYDRLEQSLSEMKFFKIESRRSNLMRSIKNMMGRSALTKQELNIHHGILSAFRGEKLK